jgi:hypothetical protein
MCGLCAIPLWDPDRNRLRKHSEKACAAERRRTDREFDAAEQPRELDWARMEF